MNNSEIEALTEYLEFNLVTMCEQLEKHIDPDAIGVMYDHAYGILTDMERTLKVQQQLVSNPSHH